MPELKIARPDGSLVEDAFAIVVSTMHLPMPDQVEARKRLCDDMRVRELLQSFEDGFEDEFPRPVLDSQIRMMRQGRPLEELVPDISRHYRDAFIAAHWLVFRLFGATNRPQLNSTARWADYASAYLMPNLPNGPDYAWTINQKTLRSTVRKYGRVAHLWAAVTYDESCRRRILTDPGSICWNTALAWANLARTSRKPFFRRAQGYYRAAVAAGIFSANHEDALVRPGDVWTLPESIEIEAPRIDHPDHLISVNFDKVEEEYVPKGEASAEARGEQQKSVKVELRVPAALVKPEPARIKTGPSGMKARP